MTDPANAHDNFAIRLWPSQQPQYENWYLLVNHPTRRFSFWFRYTLVSTTTGVRECRVWAIPVDGDDPKATRVYTQPLPQDAFRQELTPWKVTCGDAGVMEHGRVRGRVVDQGATVEWDFAFVPSSFSLVPVRSPLVSKLMGVPTRSPNSAVRMTGHVSINGDRVDLKDATAHQGHTAGTRMRPMWVWGRAGGFEQDPDAFFEGITNVREGKPIAFHVGAHGQRFHLNSLRHLKGGLLGLLGGANHTSSQQGQWTMNGQESGRKITATLNAVGMEPTKVRYLDTDGTLRFNCMYALASCALNITPALQGTNVSSTLLAKNRANMEFVSTEPALGRAEEFLPAY